MTSGIYMIENQANGKIYIGQTSDLERRKKEHLNKLKNKTHHNLHLQNSFNKYGEDNFVFKIIKKNIPYYLLDSLEKRYIDIFQSNIYPEVHHREQLRQSEYFYGNRFRQV